MASKKDEKLITQSLDSVVSDRFGRYSKYIIQQRALPDVRDGLKPVQRRILYSMFELGINHNKAFKKSARVVGDVIGKYHPHGDSSIYEAMVRMAQDWKMNVPLIEMHGNKGSIDDDPAAAMRYTEVRLQKISQLMLGLIKQKTVSFSPNFDDSEREPTVLPCFIPNLLLNGAKGIAAGFATEMPPHNLDEILEATIAKIKSPNARIQTLMNFMKGPDFPTGGQLYGTKGIVRAFETGRGRIKLIATCEIEKTKMLNQIIVKDIPYGVIKSKLIRQIDDISELEKFGGIIEVRDETNREGIRIIIELEKNADATKILKYLFLKTELQIYFSYNNIAIKNNRPTLLSLIELLDSYILFIKEIETKSLNYELQKFKDRFEIVIGFMRVANITQEIIDLIRQTDESKKGVILALVNVFDFTQRQAEAIADLKLYKLSRTDVKQYEKEKTDLETNIIHHKDLLKDEALFDKHIINILRTIKKEYATPRKTQIHINDIDFKVSKEDLIPFYEMYLSISKNGYLKSFSNKTFLANDLQFLGVKDNDNIIYLSKINSKDKLLLFTNKGNYIYLPAHLIREDKWKNIGTHINDLILLSYNELIVSVIAINHFTLKANVVMMSKFGYAKRVALKDFKVMRYTKSYLAFKFKIGSDELIGVQLCNNLNDILIINNKGNAVKFSENQIRISSCKSGGIKTMNLTAKNYVSCFISANDDDNILLFSKRGTIKLMSMNQISHISKKTIGKLIFKQLKTKPLTIFKILKHFKKNQYLVSTNQNTNLILKHSDFNVSKDMEGFKNIKMGNFNDVIWVDESNSFSLINQTYEKIAYTKQIQSTGGMIPLFKKTNESNLVRRINNKIKAVEDLDIDKILNRIKK